jgi:anti-sigma B factor antagonist
LTGETGRALTPGEFAIDRRASGSTVRIVCAGELDLASAPLLSEAWRREQRDGAELIVLDLEQVTFMDSSGLHVLVRAQREDAQRLRIILSRPAARVVDISGLRGTLPIVEG